MKKVVKWVLSITILLSVLANNNIFVYANDNMEYSVENYTAVLEELNSKYNVNVEYFDEYYQKQISPQDLKKYIEDKLQSNVVKYQIDHDIMRAQGKGVKVVKQYPAEITVYFTYSYSDVTGAEYFTKCDNVTSRTTTAATIAKFLFTQKSYTAKVIDSQRTLAVSVYGTYTDYNYLVPIKIDNYKIYFELYYDNI